jgi:hypothetical protein
VIGIEFRFSRTLGARNSWLKDHTSVEVITRDRCPAFAQAATEGAPWRGNSPTVGIS